MSPRDVRDLVREHPCDLIINMRRLADADLARFNAAAREICPAAPIVLLLPNEMELMQLGDRRELGVDGIYVWNGDALLFLAIIKEFEDLWNAELDTERGRRSRVYAGRPDEPYPLADERAHAAAHGQGVRA